MERFVKGDVVVLPFPFSDLSSSKKRPALVIANLPGEDIILCQITSKIRSDEYSLTLTESDFKQGGLKLMSAIKPQRIFTAARSIILYKVGSLKELKIKEVEEEIIKIFRK